MTKLEQMQRVESCGVVAIIRANSSAELIEVAAAIKAGGVDLIEVTMTTPNALSVISDVAAQYGNEVLVGVGSVLDAETARAAMLAGAEFVVSPVTKPDVIEICNRYSKIVMPGAFTPTEILAAWEAGADYVKVFPSSSGGPSYIKDVKAPLPHIPMIPTGGRGYRECRRIHQSRFSRAWRWQRARQQSGDCRWAVRYPDREREKVGGSRANR